jgi:hypothetical protein
MKLPKVGRSLARSVAMRPLLPWLIQEDYRRAAQHMTRSHRGDDAVLHEFIYETVAGAG